MIIFDILEPKYIRTDRQTSKIFYFFQMHLKCTTRHQQCISEIKDEIQIIFIIMHACSKGKVNIFTVAIKNITMMCKGNC